MCTLIILQTLFYSSLATKADLRGEKKGNKKSPPQGPEAPAKNQKQFIVTGHMNRGVSSPGHGHKSQST